MLYFCGPLQTRFAQTVHGPQSIAAFPVPSACNNLLTRGSKSLALAYTLGNVRPFRKRKSFPTCKNSPFHARRADSSVFQWLWL